jgi:wyosine [tRNA(Phe)-imidazoG37] synthetase (radical SAM superfamily)
MATFLFDKIVFGPVKSRRLGVSLGINLMPDNTKLCSFNCIYCECGLNPDHKSIKVVLPTREEVKTALKKKLQSMKDNGELLNVITYAGNGEPTMHPDFANIIDDSIQLRNQLAPDARIAVLSNSTMLFKTSVVEALKKVEDNILKLDSALPETIQIMNCPVGQFDLTKVVDRLCSFQGKLVIQTLFLRGTVNGETFDNTTEKELKAWIGLLRVIKPERIMIYTISRDTPIDTLQKIDEKELNNIAAKIQHELGITAEVSA